MTTDEMKKGKPVRNSNCNGIALADDVRTRRRLQNAFTMQHPVPTIDDVGKFIIVNVGTLGRRVPEFGYYEYERVEISSSTVRYSGIVTDVKKNLVFIDRLCSMYDDDCMDLKRYSSSYTGYEIEEFDGMKYRTRICCEQISAFKSGYARFIFTPALFTKHLSLSSGGDY